MILLVQLAVDTSKGEKCGKDIGLRLHRKVNERAYTISFRKQAYASWSPLQSYILAFLFAACLWPSTSARLFIRVNSFSGYGFSLIDVKTSYYIENQYTRVKFGVKFEIRISLWKKSDLSSSPFRNNINKSLISKAKAAHLLLHELLISMYTRSSRSQYPSRYSSKQKKSLLPLTHLSITFSSSWLLLRWKFNKSVDTERARKKPREPIYGFKYARTSREYEIRRAKNENIRRDGKKRSAQAEAY